MGAISWNVFSCTSNPIRKYNTQHPSLSHWYRNINLFPIDYAFRPRLRSRLTLRRISLSAGTLGFSANSVSHTVLYATHVSIRTSDISRSSHGSPFLHHLLERSATACNIAIQAHSFGVLALAPLNLRRKDNLFRPVSCYAFFKGWLLLSQPPGCFGSSDILSHLAITLGP